MVGVSACSDSGGSGAPDDGPGDVGSSSGGGSNDGGGPAGSGGSGAGQSGTGGSGDPGTRPALVPPCDPLESVAGAVFVSPTGSADASGTLDEPTSLDAGLARLNDAKTLYLLEGTYQRTDNLSINASGTEQTPVRFKAYQCQSVVIDCADCEMGGAFLSVWGSHVEVEDIEFANGRSWTGLTAYRPHVTFRRNKVHGMQRSGITSYKYGDNPAPEYVVIEGNEVWGSVLHNQAGTAFGGWNNAVSASYAHATVRGNTIHDNHGEGIVVGGPGPVLVEGNVVYDNFAVQIYVVNSQQATVTGNLVYYTGKEEILMRAYGDLPPAGIMIANENENGPALQGGAATIVNNIVVGARHGFAYLGFQAGGGMRQTLVAGNTFYGALEEALRVDADTHSDTRITGNVFFQTGTAPLTSVEGVTGVTFSNNAFFGGEPGGASGTGDVTADPKLKSPGSFSPADYQPQAGSPLIGKGQALPELPVDFLGDPRPSQPDLGALQH